MLGIVGFFFFWGEGGRGKSRRATRIKSIFMTISISSNPHEIIIFQEFQLENNGDIFSPKTQLLSLRIEYGKGELCYTVSLKKKKINSNKNCQ